MSKCGSEITCSECGKFLGHVEFQGFYDLNKHDAINPRIERKNYIYIAFGVAKKSYCNECAIKILGYEI